MNTFNISVAPGSSSMHAQANQFAFIGVHVENGYALSAAEVTRRYGHHALILAHKHSAGEIYAYRANAEALALSQRVFPQIARKTEMLAYHLEQGHDTFYPAWQFVKGYNFAPEVYMARRAYAFSRMRPTHNKTAHDSELAFLFDGGASNGLHEFGTLQKLSLPDLILGLQAVAPDLLPLKPEQLVRAWDYAFNPNGVS